MHSTLRRSSIALALGPFLVIAQPATGQPTPTTTPGVSVAPCGWTLSSSGAVTLQKSGAVATQMAVGNATMFMLLPGPNATDLTSGTITASNIAGPGTYDVGEAVGPDASGSVFSVSGGPAQQFGIGTSNGRATSGPAKLTILQEGPNGVIGKLTGEFFVNAASPGGPTMGTRIPVDVEFWSRPVCP